MSGSNCCFLTCIQISQEAGQVVWYSYLLKNFPQFVDFPGGSDGKSVCLQYRRHGFNPWVGKIPLGKEMATHSSILVWKISWIDGGAWWAIVHVVTSQTWLSDFTSLHIVKGFDIVNKAEVNVFLELSCFSVDPMDVGNLISGSSAFSKSSLNIWKFMVHVLLKPGLENFEHYFASVWDECNCAVVWTFFGIAFLWD